VRSGGAAEHRDHQEAVTGPVRGIDLSDVFSVKFSVLKLWSLRGLHQLLAGLNLRATTINVPRAELIRDSGSDSVDDQIATLRTELDITGLASLTPAIELAGAFHQAVLDDHIALTVTLRRLREQTSDEDHAFFVDIAHFMAGLPLPADHTAPQLLDGEHATRERWRELVTARQAGVRTRR
jgi:hypothetical protein